MFHVLLYINNSRDKKMDYEIYKELVAIYKDLVRHWVGQTKPVCLMKFEKILMQETKMDKHDIDVFFKNRE